MDLSLADEDIDHKLSEKCGVFGAFNLENAAKITYFGLYALQHRGQESSGIAASDGSHIHAHRGEGLVAQVYSEADFQHLKGRMAIGHNRYSTSGGNSFKHIQPVHGRGDDLALAHNGNLPSTKLLEKFLKEKKIDFEHLNDSEMMYEAILWHKKQGLPLEECISQSYPHFSGVFCLLVMDSEKLVAVCDPCGIRPLALGKLNGGWVISSETCAISTVNAKVVREIEPGEMVVISKDGVKNYHLVRGNRKFDIFEFVYFARPDSTILGKSVYQVRLNFGKILAKEYPIKADVVIPVPESAIPAAIGYATQSKIPFQMGLIKNRYIGRTFIMPDQKMRDNGVRMKLNPIPELIEGKRVIVVDDSIVRGTTIKKIVAMLRGVGAKEVHVIVSSPPVKYPDF
jgi:amidophosphoribosyltransferase